MTIGRQNHRKRNTTERIHLKRRTRADFLMDEADYLRDRDHESQAMTGELVAEDEDDFEPR